jgi:hypothetical protein
LPVSDSLTRRVLPRTHDPHRFSHPFLRIIRHSAPFRGSAIVPTISSFLSRALKRCVPVYTKASLKWIVFGIGSLASLTGSSRPGLLCTSGRYSSRSRRLPCRFRYVLARYAGRSAEDGPPATGRLHARRSLRAVRDRHLPTAVLDVSARSPSCRPPRASHIS